MMNMDDEKLIAFVSTYPEIFNKKNRYYRAVERKKSLWELIGKELNTSGEICMRRWVALRDRYGRELRKAEAPSGNEAQFYKKWHLMEAMQFLKPHIITRPVRYSQNIFASAVSPLPAVGAPLPSTSPTLTLPSSSPIKLPSPSPPLMLSTSSLVSLSAPSLTSAVSQPLPLGPIAVSLPSPSPPSEISPTSISPPITASLPSPSPSSSLVASPAPTQTLRSRGGKRRANNFDVEKSMLEAVELFKKRCLAREEQNKNSALHGFGITIVSILSKMSEAKQLRTMQRILEVAFEMQQEPE
ncbi:PREDICTED: transcription factor Adf-1-like [Rhagoletis zephyria]|uniref:transcription factor Adf-1-like n=1 Tax=Rhagoletis zephyria TaxID=28612 RepID=UPI00081129A1|nr:PREDICTED: transcription factor Adf-1-like [Rhagoletis zephyria]